MSVYSPLALDALIETLVGNPGGAGHLFLESVKKSRVNQAERAKLLRPYWISADADLTGAGVGTPVVNYANTEGYPLIILGCITNLNSCYIRIGRTVRSGEPISDEFIPITALAGYAPPPSSELSVQGSGFNSTYFYFRDPIILNESEQLEVAFKRTADTPAAAKVSAVFMCLRMGMPQRSVEARFEPRAFIESGRLPRTRFVTMPVNFSGAAGQKLPDVQTKSFDDPMFILGATCPFRVCTAQFKVSGVEWSRDELPIWAQAGYVFDERGYIEYPKPIYVPARTVITGNFTNVGHDYGDGVYLDPAGEITFEVEVP